MSTLIQTLNAVADGWSALALGLLIQSSLVIVILLLLDRALRRHVRAAVRYGLLLLVLVKLMLPPGLALPTGLAYWVPWPSSASSEPGQASTFVTVQEIASELDAGENQVGGWQATDRKPITWSALLMCMWGMGVVGLGCMLVRRSIRARRIVRETMDPSPALGGLFEECLARMGQSPKIQVRVSDRLSSPALCGLVRPTILIPAALAERLASPQLRAILIHELAHVSRWDLWINHLQTVLQILYWCHPLVWLANARLRQVREEAVDDAVMEALADDADRYPATLIEVAKVAVLRPVTSLGFLGILESRGKLSRRIRRLIEEPRPQRATVGWPAAVALIIGGAMLLPMARADRHEDARHRADLATVAESTKASPQVLVDCMILEITAEAFRSVHTALPSFISEHGDRVWVHGPAEFRSLQARLADMPGVQVLSRPRLVTGSGVTGTISVLRATNLDGRTIHLGPVCEITSVPDGTQVNLTVKAILAELAPDHPAGHVERLVADAQVSVPSGGGAFVHRGEGTDVGSARRLAFVVKPTILNEVELERLVAGPDVPTAERDATTDPGDSASADPSDDRGQATPTVPHDVPQITIEAKFVEAPESVVAGLTMGTALPSPEGNDPARSLSVAEYHELIQQLERSVGVDILAAPRITTFSGRQAQISILRLPELEGAAPTPGAFSPSGPASRELELLGPTLDILPRVTGDGQGFDLVILASAPGLVPTHMGLPVLQERRQIARVTIPRGQTLLLVAAPWPTPHAVEEVGTTPASAGQPPPVRRLLVLVTPTLVHADGTIIRSGAR
jgi:beta-lactamase regulating signal transducer with metallopeptidase domain